MKNYLKKIENNNKLIICQKRRADRCSECHSGGHDFSWCDRYMFWDDPQECSALVFQCLYGFINLWVWTGVGEVMFHINQIWCQMDNTT